AVWSPLLLFRQIHDVDTWESQHGMLPDWVVVPYQLKLDFMATSLSVEPEVLSRKGRRGIGHSVLKIGERKRHVYIIWEPHNGEQASASLGLPDRAPDEVNYAQLDVLDMYPVYQCQQCGWFVDSNVAPEILEEHSHRRGKPHLEDVLNHPGDFRLLAEITPARREDIRDYRLPPEYFVDRRKVLTFMRTSAIEISGSGAESYPLAREAYLYASACWVARYRHDLQAAQAL